VSTPSRLTVLASGSGTNLQALLDACSSGVLNAQVVSVISDVPQAHALQRAHRANVSSVIAVPGRRSDQSRRDWDSALAETVAKSKPDVVVLAGFMRLLSSAFLNEFSGRVVNLHPALPGELPGLNAIERAYEQFRHGERTHSGVMVHMVPDEGVDNGPVLRFEVVAFTSNDSLESFAARMHEAEHRLLVAALQQFISMRSHDAKHT
jgi:phosphoribosylglycinamide formyltransferase 1